MDTKVTEVELAAMFREAAGVAAMPADWTPVGVWLRVSPGPGQDEANQVPAVMRHCIDRNYWPARWYVVHAKSAYHGQHQADLDQAIDDMRTGSITILVCWHSDRLERRKGKALLDLLAEFTDASGKVESVLEPTLGQLDFGGQVTTFITGLMNHEKSKHLAEQVGIAFDRIHTNNGTANRVPWGYDTAGPKYNRQMVPTDLCRKYVPLIFQRCIDGESCRTIAAWLTAEGVPTAKGRPWNEGQVRWLIRNRTYAGRRTRRNDTETYQRCEAVVTMDVWERANNALSNRPKRGPVAKGDRPMLAKLRCLHCDSPMYRIKAGKDNFARYYYRCFGNGPQRKGCGNMVPFERLEHLTVVRFLAWNNDRPYQIREWVKGKNWDAEIADLTQDIRELAPNPTADRWLERMAEMQAQVIEYERKNREEREGGHYEYTDVLNADGSVMTIGQHFFDLDKEGRREYLTTHDIRAEKAACCGGIRVVVDGREDIAHKQSCAEYTADL